MDLNSTQSTEANSTYEDIAELRHLGAFLAELNFAKEYLFFLYRQFYSFRKIAFDYRKMFPQTFNFAFSRLESMQEMFDVFPKLNTPAYACYVHNCRNRVSYVDYAVELPKIKHRILESEIDWYIENIARELELAQKEKHSSIIKPVGKQDPREARHTRMVIYHALEQLENIASKITAANAKDYAKNKGRYKWCLAAMIPLLSEEEQDPFKENGIHQRWKKARDKMNEIEFQSN